jgi:hypothetical protein
VTELPVPWHRRVGVLTFVGVLLLTLVFLDTVNGWAGFVLGWTGVYCLITASKRHDTVELVSKG